MATARIPMMFRALLLLFIVSFAGLSLAEAIPQAVEGSAKAEQQGSECVRDPQWMRMNHMEVIRHQRDLTVHQGIRGSKDALANCVDCHARKDAGQKPVPVNAQQQFCAGCHTYTATSITCFQCHSNVPDDETSQR